MGRVHAPWVAASALIVLALRRLLDEDCNVHSHAWRLFGTAAICLSIGCGCKVSWSLERGGGLGQPEGIGRHRIQAAVRVRRPARGDGDGHGHSAAVLSVGPCGEQAADGAAPGSSA